jgi:hypothetical protein
MASDAHLHRARPLVKLGQERCFNALQLGNNPMLRQHSGRFETSFHFGRPQRSPVAAGASPLALRFGATLKSFKPPCRRALYLPDFRTKLVDTAHYHLWTDALHLRALAHQARNRWDRGTYVRCVLTNTWTALEMACNDALDVTDIGYSFRKKLDSAVEQKALARLDWSHGVWKEVSELLALRKEFIHQGISTHNRFAEAHQADAVIDVCRRAIKVIYSHALKTAPEWVTDDSDPGFQEEQRCGIPHITLDSPGIDPAAADTIRIVIVYKDEERTIQNCSAGKDYGPLLDEVIRGTRVPISAVRAYRGTELLENRDLLMRGN